MSALSGPSHAKPISWPPSEYWDGADGDWSSFMLRVGSPEQVVRILPSSAGQAVWVVSTQGCVQNEAGKPASINCADSRGELFDPSMSTSWNDAGNYTMEMEMNLGFGDTANFGLETIALGASDAIGGPQLTNQTVAAFTNDDFYIGLFGLNQQPTNVTSMNNPQPSFLETLRARNFIPSLSWGYTAGARYQSKGGAFASLTLGGYDSSRIIFNNVSFALNPDISRDLVVGLQSITAEFTNGSACSLLPDPIWTFIDSSIPYIYLPIEACKLFETTFGLVWNSTYETYFVPENVHQSLLEANSNVTFQIANAKAGGGSVEISLPYSSFDLVMNYPLVPTNISGARYFPLMRASNDSQYTLGRIFLQEAYLVTNYDQSNFSVFKSTYEDGVRPHIVPISSAKSEPESRLSHAAKIGIGVGATSFLLLCLAMVVIAFRKLRKGRDRRRLFRNRKFINFSQQSQLSNASSPRTIAMNSSTNSRRELADSGKLELNGETPPSELRNEALESIMRTAYELNEPTAPIAHELMSRDSNERIMLQNHTAKSKYKIFMTTNISRRSWTSIGTSNEVPYVKTTISSQTANRVEIDRSLPPTPISESVQCSPIQGNFGQSVTTHNGHEALSNSPDIARSVYGDIGQISSPARLNAWQRSFAHLSYSSMDLEIVIPPESTDVEIIKPLSIYNKRGRNRRNFF